MYGGSWLITVLNLFADIPWHCPFVKDLIVDVSVGAQGSAISAFNPFAALRCVFAQTEVPFLSLLGSGGDIYEEGLLQCWK